MFSSRSISIKGLLVLAFAVVFCGTVRSQINPNQVNWPTGTTGCVYAPATNTCVSPGGAPSGTAGGDLSGTYPNPGVAGFGGIPFSNTPAPDLGDLICYDGVEYTPCPPEAGAAQILYLTNTASDIGSDFLWDIVPLGTQFTATQTIPATTTKTAIKSFATASTFPDVTTIPAGEWQADSYVQVSGAANTTTLQIDVYDVHSDGSSPVLLFSFPNQTISGNGTGIQEQTVEAIEPAFTMAAGATDRLLITYSMTKTGGPSITGTLYGGGSANYSHVHTPIGTASGGITQLTGDVAAGPGIGSQAATLATVNSGPGTCGDSTHVCQVTVNGKGLTTAQTQVAISGGGGTYYLQRAAGSLFAPGSSVQFTNEEPSVIYEGSPQLLSSSYGKVFKMWYDAGYTSPDSTLYYAESPDGMPGTWVQSGSNPLVNPCARNWVFKNGSTYELFCANGSAGTHIDRYTSSDGISWSLAHANVITATQSWQSSAAGSPGNIAVVISGGTWYALVEWLSTDGIWRTGLWTSSDGNTFTPYSGNPVIPTNGMSSTGMCGGPWLGVVGGTFYALEHCNGSNGTGSGNLPTDIYEFSSSNAETWTPVTAPWLQRSTQDEGIGLVNGQVADPFLVEADVTGSGSPRSYLFYEGTTNGTVAGTGPLTGLHLKVATVSATAANILAGTVFDGDPKPNTTQTDQCLPGNLETAAFAGPQNLAITAYKSPCGNTFAVYSNDGASAVTSSLNGANGAYLFVSGTNADMLDSYAPGSADYVVSMTASSNGGGPALFARANSAANTNYFLGCNDGAGANCKLYKQVAGTPTQLGSTYTFTWTAGATHTIGLSTVGTAISALVDGAVVIGPVTDSAISAAGQAGFRVTAGVQASSFAIRGPVSPSSGLSGMTANQVPIAATSSTVTSSKPIAGTGAGLASGPTSATVVGDVVTYADTAGTQQDSSTLLSSLAPKSSPTFTGTPAAPTATGGTNTTQLATTAFVQAAIAAAGTGAGIVTYSGPSLTFTGTQYFPIGGGGLSSTTETNVDIDSPAAVTIQNMTVQLSTAPGVGNSIVFTWRKNASSQTLTCTISGASATSCSDTTHNFTTASLDLLDIQTVTTGTVVGTPTVVMAAQVGVAAPATGVTSVFGQTGAVPNLSGDVTTAGSSVATVKGINGVPLCTGFTPTNGQNLQYTTASTPNPCYTASSAGSTVTALPPYLEIGSTLYTPTDSMSTATLPAASPTWINSVAPTSTTAGANGNLLLKTTSAINAWAELSGSASAEGVVSITTLAAQNAGVFPSGGVWVYDSTNSKIYDIAVDMEPVSATSQVFAIVAQIYTYSGSGNPSFSSNIVVAAHGTYGFSVPAHLKVVASGGTLTFEYSLDGGQTFIVLTTHSVGTIADGGYFISGVSGTTTAENVMSIAVN